MKRIDDSPIEAYIVDSEVETEAPNMETTDERDKYRYRS